MIRFFAISAYLTFLGFIIKDILEIRKTERQEKLMRCIICYVKRKEDGTIPHLRSCPDFKEPKPTAKKP